MRAKAEGIATLDPKRCASWLSPFVKDGASYAATLMRRFSDPALARLIGATCDAYVMARALMSLAASGDRDALSEARSWGREHRACLRELCALTAVNAKEEKDANPWLALPTIDASDDDAAVSPRGDK